ALPVERRLGSFRLEPLPAVGEPGLRPPVAPVLDEREELPAGDGAAAEQEGAQEERVPRSLVVEGEAVGARADLDDASLVRDPGPAAGRAARGRGLGDAARSEHVARERELEVGEEQLLVLLLVLEAELE